MNTEKCECGYTNKGECMLCEPDEAASQSPQKYKLDFEELSKIWEGGDKQSYQAGMERIWNSCVVPFEDKYDKLQKEMEEYRERYTCNQYTVVNQKAEIGELKSVNKELLEAAKLGLKYTYELTEIYNVDSTEMSQAVKDEVRNAAKKIRALISKHSSNESRTTETI